jgi:hypothetical protein
MVDISPPPTLFVNGILVSLGKLDGQVLVTGDFQRLRRPQKLKIANFELRFGVAMLYETDYMFPQLVIDDFARQHHGRDGIAFMFDEGDAYPRADVIGIRKSTGAPDQLFMKQVDLACNLRCFASRDGHYKMLSAVVWIDSSAETWQTLSSGDVRADNLLLRSVPCYITNLTNLDKIVERVLPSN